MNLPILQINQATKRRVFTLNFNFGFSRQDLMQELEDEHWRSPSEFNPLGTDLWDAQRAKVMEPKANHPIMRQLVEYFHSRELKQQLIDYMFAHLPDLSWEYNCDPTSMAEETYLHGEFTRDSPGFVNVLHTDYRKLVATGMIYLTERDDPDLSTMFYDSFERTNPVRIPTHFGQGWWHANGNDTWHEGWNRTNQYRYTVLLGLTMNVQKIPN